MNFDPVINDPVYSDKDYPPSLRSIILKSGGCKLLSTLLIADGPGPHPTVLFLHGFPGNEHNFDIAHAIRRMGWNVFTFHYRGMWGSGGDFSWNNAIADVTVAVDFLKSKEAEENYRVDGKRIVIIGYSMGGFTGLMYASKDDAIQNVASIAGYNFGLVGKMIGQVPNGKELALESLELGVSFVNGTTTHKLLDELIENADRFNLLNYIKAYLSKNILMIGATYDSTAPMDVHFHPMIKSLEAAGVNKLRKHIIESGHGFSTKRIELTRTVVDWLSGIEF